MPGGGSKTPMLGDGDHVAEMMQFQVIPPLYRFD
jgi:hypothetical protein